MPVSRAATSPPVSDSARPERRGPARAAGRAPPTPSSRRRRRTRRCRATLADLGLPRVAARRRPPPRRRRRRLVRRTSRPFQPLARNASVGSPASSRRGDDVVEALVEPALALAPHACSTRLAITDGSPARAPQVGQHGPLEHLVHLVRHAGHGVDHLRRRRPDRADQPRRGAPRLRDDRRADRHHRLAQVVLGHRAGRGRRTARGSRRRRPRRARARRPSPRRSRRG